MTDHFRHDLKQALRVLRNRPAVSAVALLALALGIGANTAIFSVVEASLLRPLPYGEPERLVMLWHDYGAMLHKASLSVPAYVEYRDHMSSLENVAVSSDCSANLPGTVDPERPQGASASATFLRTPGV